MMAPMPTEVWLTAAAAAAYVALALVATAGRARQPLAAQLGLMSAGLFAYNLAELLSLLDAREPWVFLSDAAAALATIPTLELFLGFLGLTRRTRLSRLVARLYFGALAALSLLPIVFAPAALAHDSGAWALAMLAGLVPAFASVALLVVRHYRRSRGPERSRTQLVGGALLLGVGAIASDLGAMAGADLPRLSYVGLLAAAVLLAVLTLRGRIVEAPSIATLVTATIVGLLGVVALQLVASLAGRRSILFALGAVAVVATLALALRPLFAASSEERARLRSLATLGRFSRQMAHDLRNPLAAIKGAAQFLKEERRAGRSLDDHEDFLDVILESSERMDRLTAEYLRMGRLELAPTAVDVAGLVHEATRAAQLAGQGGTKLVERIAEGLPTLRADRDLLLFALENVLRNAREASPEDAEIVIVAEAGRMDRASTVLLTVTDRGAGMDVRTRERALAGFFTTKEGGTGFGLTFVARVVEAHRGALRIDSEEGKGTSVTLELPALDAEGPPSAG